MFIFIFFKELNKEEKAFIYIPLCLYLYGFAIEIIVKQLRIYIPLCLYLYGEMFMIERIFNLIYIPLCLYLYPSLIISCIFAACNTLYCLPAKSKQFFTFLTLVFSLYSSIFIEYSTFVVLPVF